MPYRRSPAPLPFGASRRDRIFDPLDSASFNWLTGAAADRGVSSKNSLGCNWLGRARFYSGPTRSSSMSESGGELSRHRASPGASRRYLTCRRENASVRLRLLCRSSTRPLMHRSRSRQIQYPSCSCSGSSAPFSLTASRSFVPVVQPEGPPRIAKSAESRCLRYRRSRLKLSRRCISL
jgi:hypothetical protein